VYEKNLEMDTNWYNRMFVITNAGIQILKKMPDHLKCHTCPEYKFCPRGPIQDFCIKFTSIDTIVNFPNQPQKLLLKYHLEIYSDIGAIEEIVTFQMTLNFFTFTKASKIYQVLMAIMSKCDYEIELEEEDADEGALA